MPDPGNHGNFFDEFCGGTCSSICGGACTRVCAACLTSPLGGHTVGQPYWATEVGAFTASASPYGTFDQGGNVWEWNETVIGDERGNLGGGWNEDLYFGIATNRFHNDPTFDFDFRFGFRVARLD